MKLGTDAHAEFVNKCMKDAPDLSGRDLAAKILNEFHVDVSISTVNSFRHKLGWTQHGTRYCQLITNRNKVKRVDWCQEMLDSQETFDVSIALLV
jgi:hypothetical protein